MVKLQTVKKTCNCRYTRTKYSAGTDEKRRYGRSDDIAEVVIDSRTLMHVKDRDSARTEEKASL